MSAFLVKNSTISRLADWLRFKDEQGGYFKSFENTYELAKALYNLNVRALKERYDDEVFERLFTPFEFTGGVFFNNEEGKAQAYMSLSCLLYQCFEGTVPETELYKKLEDFRVKMAKEIASEWARKQGAVWD